MLLQVYDIQSVIGTIRAAEKLRSPAIIEIFPVTLKYGGKPFLRASLSPLLAHWPRICRLVDYSFADTLPLSTCMHAEALLSLAAEATVPVAIHLDHATTDEDIDRALTFAEEGARCPGFQHSQTVS